MADKQTLIDFVTWGVKTYTADHYILILSDHGTGWPGGLDGTRIIKPKPARKKSTALGICSTRMR